MLACSMFTWSVCILSCSALAPVFINTCPTFPTALQFIYLSCLFLLTVCLVILIFMLMLQMLCLTSKPKRRVKTKIGTRTRAHTHKHIHVCDYVCAAFCVWQCVLIFHPNSDERMTCAAHSPLGYFCLDRTGVQWQLHHSVAHYTFKDKVYLNYI